MIDQLIKVGNWPSSCQGLQIAKMNVVISQHIHVVWLGRNILGVVSVTR